MFLIICMHLTKTNYIQFLSCLFLLLFTFPQKEKIPAAVKLNTSVCLSQPNVCRALSKYFTLSAVVSIFQNNTLSTHLLMYGCAFLGQIAHFLLIRNECYKVIRQIEFHWEKIT